MKYLNGLFRVERLADTVTNMHDLSGKIKYLEVIKNRDLVVFLSFHIIDITIPKLHGTAELSWAPSKGMPVD